MRIVLAVACALAMASSPARAQGEADAQCLVTEVRASNEKAGIDPKLDKEKAKLFAKPPFSAFDSFKVLGEQAVPLERQKMKPVKLVNGNLTLTLKDKTIVQAGKPRLRIDVRLEDAKGAPLASPIYSGNSGDSLALAGTSYQGGTYVLVLTCSAQ
jgi:hypothetical protein